MELHGKTAVVTGSTSGIGLGVAIALAQIKSHGTAVAFDGANMLRPDEIANLVQNTESRFGAADILVNNAGIQHVAPLEEFPDEKWDAIIGINLSSSFHTIKAALPGMRARDWGRIINICSAHSLRASPHKAAYVAAKHGLAGLTKVVALETAKTGITCNAISPGFVWTPLVEKQLPDIAKAEGISIDDAKQRVLQRQPSGRFATVDQIGALVRFLSSDAAGAITGSNYSIDGGWTAL